jgi:hypothetical protein
MTTPVLSFTLERKLSMSLDDLIACSGAAVRLQALWRGFRARRSLERDQMPLCDCDECRYGYYDPRYDDRLYDDAHDWYWNDGSGYCDW